MNALVTAAAARTVEQFLASHEVPFELLAHPRTFSTTDAAQAAHIPADHIAKAVIVKDDGGGAMVVLPGDHWVSLNRLQAISGRAFELASEPQADAFFTDCLSGAIPPLGLAYGLETFVDERLLSLANVYFEAGNHEHLVHIDGNGFRRLMTGAHIGYFSHDPR